MNGKAYSDRKGVRVFTPYVSEFRHEYPRNGRYTAKERIRLVIEEMLQVEGEYFQKQKRESPWWFRYPYIISIRPDYYRGGYFYAVDKVI